MHVSQFVIIGCCLATNLSWPLLLNCTTTCNEKLGGAWERSWEGPGNEAGRDLGTKREGPAWEQSWEGPGNKAGRGLAGNEAGRGREQSWEGPAWEQG